MGTDDFLALAPLFEPLSAGAPPHAPALVQRLTVIDPVRRMVTASGHVVTCPLAAGAVRGAGSEWKGRRARFEVRWSNLTRAERDDLIAFFRDEVIVGPEGGVFAFDLSVDGDGITTAGGVSAVVPVRPIDGALASARGSGGWNGAGETADGAFEMSGVVEELV